MKNKILITVFAVVIFFLTSCEYNTFSPDVKKAEIINDWSQWDPATLVNEYNPSCQCYKFNVKPIFRHPEYINWSKSVEVRVAHWTPAGSPGDPGSTYYQGNYFVFVYEATPRDYKQNDPIMLSLKYAAETIHLRWWVRYTNIDGVLVEESYSFTYGI